jgi:hypothetical protein
VGTWRSYDAATSEDAFLDPLYICTECGSRKDEAFKACARCGNKEAEKFVFPAQCPAAFSLEFFSIQKKYVDKAKEEGAEFEGFPIMELIPHLGILLGAKRYKRLQELDSSVGLGGRVVGGVMDDLLIAYGFAPGKDGEEVPLGTKGKKPKGSGQRSRRTSASSKRTSKGSSGSKTSTQIAKEEAGAGSSTASKP